jgi:hypothetical protein
MRWGKPNRGCRRLLRPAPFDPAIEFYSIADARERPRGTVDYCCSGDRLIIVVLVIGAHVTRCLLFACAIPILYSHSLKDSASVWPAPSLTSKMPKPLVFTALQAVFSAFSPVYLHLHR